MKNTVTRATWGILFILLGLALAGRAFGFLEFNLFFNGWWTLFIIIPCALGLSERGNRTSSVIGLGIGILLLLSAQGVFAWYMFGKILIAFIFVVIGCTLILRGNQEKGKGDYTKRISYDYNTEKRNAGDSENANTGGPKNTNTGNYENGNSRNYGNTNHGGYNHFSGVLSGRNVQFIDEVFAGAVVSSILGNVQLDLRNAIFTDNAVVEITCILGGIDIFVPPNVKVLINCTPILAGVDNDVISPLNTSGEIYTLYINGTCILGGVDVK